MLANETVIQNQNKQSRMLFEAIYCLRYGLNKQLIFGTLLSYSTSNKMVQLNLNSSLTFAVKITVILPFFFFFFAAQLWLPAQASKPARSVILLGGVFWGQNSSCSQPGVVPVDLPQSMCRTVPQMGWIPCVGKPPNHSASTWLGAAVPFACFTWFNARKRLAMPVRPLLRPLLHVRLSRLSKTHFLMAAQPPCY